jgi:hypothetical protein
MPRSVLPSLACSVRWGAAALGGVLLLAACSSGGEHRTVAITIDAESCTPETIAAKPGERLALEVTNHSAADREIEGIDGTKLAEVLIPAGRSRTINYTLPDGADAHRVKCYQPGGPTTIIEIQASAAGAAGTSQFQTNDQPVQTVSVTLDSYAVAPSVTKAPAGAIRFDAHNANAHDVHELAVLLIKPDGTKQIAGEIEDIDPGNGGSITLKLPAGKYELACLIAKGEAGSAVDHYAGGMHTPFEVE